MGIIDYYEYVNEGRPVGSKNKPKTDDEPANDDVVVAGKVVKMKDPEKDLSKLKGQPASKSHGVFAVDEPTDNDNLDNLDPDEISENEEQLINALSTCLGSKSKHVGFFIIGHAGWGKTSIIKSIAKKFKMSVITVYLDKAERTDLGGIPVAVHENGQTYQSMAMPMWARYMYDRPDQKFLLFFDEFNQATPDIMNALMPIVQEHEIAGYKFDNFIVGAAGNYQDENVGVLSDVVDNKALAQRLIRIPWKDGDDESWDDALKFMHKTWDKEFDGHGKEIIDLFSQKNIYSMFESPRLIDQQILEDFNNKLEVHQQVMKGEKPKVLAVTPKRLLMKLEQVVSLNTAVDINDRTVQNNIRNLADNIFNIAFNAAGDEVGASEKKSTARRSVASLSEAQLKTLKKMLTTGRLGNMRDPDTKEYIEVSVEDLENPDVFPIVDQFKDCTAEMMKQAIKALRMEGVKPKYEKTSDVPEHN